MKAPATPPGTGSYQVHVNPSRSIHWLLLLTLGVGSVLAQTLPVEESAPSPEFVPGRPGAQMVVDRLLMLEHRIIATQHEMLQTLAAATQALKRQNTTSEGERRSLIERTMLFNQQLLALRRQIPYLDQALTDTRAEQEFPPSVFSEIERLRKIVVENQGKVTERHRILRELYREQAGETEPEILEEMAEQEQEESESSPGDPRIIPLSEAEAAKLLEAGQIQTPRHLTELFERVHERRTPKGSLRRYQQYRE